VKLDTGRHNRKRSESSPTLLQLDVLHVAFFHRHRTESIAIIHKFMIFRCVQEWHAASHLLRESSSWEIYTYLVSSIVDPEALRSTEMYSLS
jgi:hypothetical protein